MEKKLGKCKILIQVSINKDENIKYYLFLIVFKSITNINGDSIYRQRSKRDVVNEMKQFTLSICLFESKKHLATKITSLG